MTAIIDKTAPDIEIECWAQGFEPPINQLAGQVVLIEVVQVNCPGCFLHALPEVIRLHQSYEAQGLKVFAIATAFEHFEHNTLNKLQGLLSTGELQGDPLSQLGKTGFLDDNKLPYCIPFSVAMDKLVKNETAVNEKTINQFILSQIPDFFQGTLNEDRKQAIYQQAKSYLNEKTYHALTFDRYQLQGTPSSILIDRKGILRQVSFGAANKLEQDIQAMLNE
ncbi:hypothetical protein JYT79_01595 [Cardiobacterium sp. AH-315-I02]|nr:hypothetical protein [Cardiobacterium sp. AH-315-I02]